MSDYILPRRQRQSGIQQGLEFGAQLQQLAAPLIQQKRLEELRRQQVEDRDFNRNAQLENFKKETILKSIQHPEMGMIPLQPGQEALGPVLRPSGLDGFAISDAQRDQERKRALEDIKAKYQAMYGDTRQSPKGFNLSPGEQRFEYDPETKAFRNIASAPGKDAESKTFTLSPGQRVFDITGREIASIPVGEKETRPMVVPPGSTVIGMDGKEIFKNPANPKDSVNLEPILKEKATNALSVIEELKKLIGPGTVGTIGNVGRAIPLVANDAKQVEAKINALKSQISMSELLKMKQSGASFGALSDTELGLLGNSIDSLDVALQNPQSLISALAKIEESMKKMGQVSDSPIGGPGHGIGNRSGGGSVVDSLFNKHK